MQMEVKPDEQWLRHQISAYFESEHELTLDGRILCFAIAACCGSDAAHRQWHALLLCRGYTPFASVTLNGKLRCVASCNGSNFVFTDRGMVWLVGIGKVSMKPVVEGFAMHRSASMLCRQTLVLKGLVMHSFAFLPFVQVLLQTCLLEGLMGHSFAFLQQINRF